jgi:hypothetical protein
MSIILGALGGMGEAAQQVGAMNQKAELAQDQTQLESDLATQRAETLEQFKSSLAVQTADQQRQQMVDRIMPVQQGILDQGIVNRASTARANQLDGTVATGSDGQPAQSQGFVGDANQVLQAINQMADGPDKQAALAQLQQQVSAGKAKVGNLAVGDLTDQEKSQYAPSPTDKQSAFVQAATQTGDISPADVMKTSSSMQINQLRMESLLDRANDRNATMQEVANVRAEAMRYGYELRLQAAQEKAVSGKIDSATGRMLITSEDANIKAATSQLMMLNQQLQYMRPKNTDGTPNTDYQDIQTQIDSIRDDIKVSQSNKAAYLRSMGLMADTAQTPGSSRPAGPGAKDYSSLWKDKPRPPLSSFLTGDPAGPATPATPATQADFDALPSGSLFVNPADGRTYKKK